MQIPGHVVGLRVVSNKYLVTIHRLIVDFSFLACYIGLVNCMDNRVRINAKMHHFKPKS